MRRIDEVNFIKSPFGDKLLFRKTKGPRFVQLPCEIGDLCVYEKKTYHVKKIIYNGYSIEEDKNKFNVLLERTAGLSEDIEVPEEKCVFLGLYI